MSKNFSVSHSAQDGHFNISIWKVGGGSGRGRGWYVSDVPPEKHADVFGRILDIIGAATGQADFDHAQQAIDDKFLELCEALGCPLTPAT
jgi:hypothetical protein